jgi:Leucine-rich repeat (LRR) protein
MKKYIFAFCFLSVLYALKAQRVLNPYTDSKDCISRAAGYDFQDNCINWVISQEKKYIFSDLDYMNKYPDSVRVFYGLSDNISDVSKYTNLQVLHSELIFPKVSPEIKKLKNLLGLILEGDLKTLPPEIGELTLLRELNLKNNKLESLPPEIGKLANLRYLFLDNNKLKTLPKEIGNMKNLRLLFISDNQLESLPEEIGQLENLEELWVESNQIKNIPKSIGNCKKLKYVYMSGNPLIDVPMEINNIESLIYFRMTRSKITQERLKELKKKIPKLSY